MKTRKKILSLLLILTLIMTSLPAQLFANEANRVINPNLFVGNGYQVELKVTSQWPGSFNGEFILTNTGTKPIENWALKFDFEHKINNMWNGQITGYEGTTYTIKNLGWNQDIAPKQSISIGFGANWDDQINVPKSYSLLGVNQQANNSDYTVDFKVTQDWGHGFNGEISITNHSVKAIEGWSLEFDFDKTIERFWTAEILKHENNHYIIKNSGYNANIVPGQKLTLGFSGNTGNVISKPINYKLNQIALDQGTDGDTDKADTTPPAIIFNTSEMMYEEETEKYYLDEKLTTLYGNIIDDSEIIELSYSIFWGNMEIKSDVITPSKDWSITNIPLMVGLNKLTITAKDTYNNEGVKIIEIYNLSSENMEDIQLDENDSDSDGLLNYQEDYYGTDKLNPDTDWDGLTDLQEITITTTEPTNPDSDNNGVSDADEDFDEDGITNIDEIRLNGNPFNNDSDFDGLDDGEEVRLGTKLDERDTDDDGLTDIKEIELGTDPLNPDTNGNGIKDGQEIFSISKTLSVEEADSNIIPSIDINLPGELIDTLHISKLSENDIYLPKEMPGYIGAGYDFDLSGTFESATLTYTFTPKALEIPGFMPAIYYCDEINQEMILLDNQNIDLNNCTVSAPITHFSKYILLDMNAFEEVWIEDDDTVDGDIIPLGMAFSFDASTEMKSADPTNESGKVAGKIIDLLKEEDYGVPTSSAGSSTGVFGQLTQNKAQLKKNINVESDRSITGKPSLYGGLDISLKILQNLYPGSTSIPPNSQYCVVLFTSGYNVESWYTNQVISTVTDAVKDNKVAIYIVGVGDKVDESYINNMVTELGARYYHITDEELLLKDIENLSKNIIDKLTDTDGDGLSDYDETRLRFFNGVPMPTKIDKPDTDEDGLLDGQEVQVINRNVPNSIYNVTLNGENIEVSHTRSFKKYYASSNPQKRDTDGDDIPDDVDLMKFRSFYTPVIFLHGRTDNNEACFGIRSKITSEENSHYSGGDSNKTLSDDFDYTNVDDQKITHPIIRNGTAFAGEVNLANELSQLEAGKLYQLNKNLFSFNYPNQDMVQYNAKKLGAYIENIRIEKVKNGEKGYIYKTEKDFKDGKYQFDLIGHSMGGLVSRFYIENLNGSAHIRKLITINTPHFGAGGAIASGQTGYEFSACDIDLDPSSQLYTGKVMWGKWTGKERKYGTTNQSPRFTNQHSSTKYYAIGGYDVTGSGIRNNIKPGGDEMYHIDISKRNTEICTEFYRDTTSIEGLKSNIRTATNLNTLALTNMSGDNVVDIFSQFGLSIGKKDKFKDTIVISKTTINVDTIPGHSLIGTFFHGVNQHRKVVSDKVIAYLIE